MAQYQILVRKLLGPHGTGPKRTLEVKNSVATPPRVRRTAAARRRLPPAQCAAHCRKLRAARPAIGTVAARSYSAVVRTLQLKRRPSSPLSSRRRRRRPLRRKFVSGQFDEENPSAQISSHLLVQGDEGVSYPIMDRIGVIYRNLPRRADVIVTTVGARHKCQQDRDHQIFVKWPPAAAACGGPSPCAYHARTCLRVSRALAADWRKLSSRKETKSVWPIVDRRCALATTHGRGLPAIDCVTWPFGAALVDDRGAPDCATMRALAARLRRTIALHHASAAAHCRVDCATGGGRSAAAGRRWCALAAQASRRWLRALACGVVLYRRIFVVVAPSSAAAPASLRRCLDGWSDFF
ncbi:hypothetical protein F511_37646 [Dorcoceras hygrometricum]|uniref:Uncharacterized protein n=1 Tax=Dorcoceras hygrometricum TaxID=472368 RepID=A0A2Z7CX22_9LAMI|nr:hypothetical protein F511_37646 [Dorcoceras hygrometricum]